MVIADKNHNGLRTEQLLVVLSAMILDYLRAVRKTVWNAHENNQGREILGSVAGREVSEDVHVGIDRMCEDLLVFYCNAAYAEQGITFWIRTEHAQQGYGIGCSSREAADVECDVDPFDGTDQYLKGIEEAWWSALSFSRDGTPFLGGAVDILGGAIYLASQEGVTRLSTRTNRRKFVFPRPETALNEKSIVASYKGRWRYFHPWVGRVEKLFARKELAGITHYSNGGSFVYALLAAGVLSAYIMEAEPISEISPGAGFVKAANLCLLVVNGDTIERFEPLSGMEGCVEGVFVAACTEELAMSIAKQLQQGKWNRIMQKFEKGKNMFNLRRLAMQST